MAASTKEASGLKVFSFSHGEDNIDLLVVAIDEDSAVLQVIRKYPQYPLDDWSVTEIDTTQLGILILHD